jgi:hypothetical protein
MREKGDKTDVAGSADATSQSQRKSHYDRQSVGQPVLVSGTHLVPATNFSFSLKFYLYICWFVIL